MGIYKSSTISMLNLGCMLYKTMSAEEMAPFVIKNINNNLKYLRNRFLAPSLRRLICNASIQSHFDYACSTWYSNLTKNWKNKSKLLKANAYVSVYS